ncbi:MAG: DUF2070 family protein [Candidatus Marsarchaeota archaeon]|nr:DUF2070 family protein [Candidatus Marsarchaeota archaeon]MCL5412873.1 DUF2070 family protein [Candidatus Marsarchaeota archaeon]
MPKRDITKYSSYFERRIPNSISLAMIIVLIGILSGSLASTIVHYGTHFNLYNVLLLGAGSGILVVSLPALIMVLIIRIMKRDMKTKHALFAVMAVTAAYSIFIVFDSIIYSVFQNNALAYVILILSNASIYGYWFIINRVAVGQRKSAIFTAEIHPIINVLMFLPFGGYLLKFNVTIEAALIKLFFGILVFLAMGYVILYLFDRPAKKQLSVSSVDLFSAMMGHWLFNMAADAKVLGTGGVNRSVEVELASISSNGKYKAVFVKPDIHYGPFGNVGGSAFTEHMGSLIVSRYNASPFVMHGAVNIEDNPMRTTQTYSMSEKICSYIPKMDAVNARDASGRLGFGKKGPCRATNIRINGYNMLILSKAPLVTEDIDREIGLRFSNIAHGGQKRTMLIDAHNSRFETAGAEELKGIQKGSRYIDLYEKAIISATKSGNNHRLRFGSSFIKLSKSIHNPDLGAGYTSFGYFDFGTDNKFGLLCIDANNMLPGFREAIIKHARKKHRLKVEVCTTDTHSVNSIAMSAKNSLGRYTRYTEIMPMLDVLIDKAIEDASPAKFSRGSLVYYNFMIWGKGSEALLNKVSRDIIRIGKRTVPLVIALAYIIAGWIIYII